MRWNPLSFRRPRTIRNNRHCQLGFEALEDRRVLSTIVALNIHNELLTFDSATPTKIDHRVSITGLQPSEKVVALDFRPSTGQLFGLGTTSRIYTLDADTGAAVQVGNVAFDVELDGTYFGTAFNPTNDQMRLISDLDQNQRVDPATGQVIDGNSTTGGLQGDTNLAYVATDTNSGKNPRVVPLAYNNNTPDAVQTTLFGIDAELNVLVRVGGVNGSPDPNDGSLNTIGNLGRNVTVVSGIDIGVDGNALGVFSSPRKHAHGLNPSFLGTLNLASGTLTGLGRIGNFEHLLDMSVVSRDETVFALTTDGHLVSFNSGDPAAILSNVAITGMQTNETMTSIDFRPADGKLYGVGSTGRLYSINTQTGAVTAISTTPITPQLSAEHVANDFDAVNDKLRVVTESGRNFRIDPITGAVPGNAADTNLAFASTDTNVSQVPHVVAAAYNSNFKGATGVTLFDVDSTLDVLVRQGSVQGTPTAADAGQLSTIGSLGIDVTDEAGLDFSAGSGGVGLAAFQVQGDSFSRLYRINTSTGAATEIGRIGGSTVGVIHDIAIAPPQIQFSVATKVVDEGNGHVNLTLTRTGGTSSAMAVTVNTADASAIAGTDYTAIVNQVVTFQIGDSKQTITIPITNDRLPGSDRSFTVTITNPTNGAQLGKTALVTVTIQEDDGISH